MNGIEKEVSMLRLTNVSKSYGTVLAVVHDRAFSERVTGGIWELRAGKLHVRQ